MPERRSRLAGLRARLRALLGAEPNAGQARKAASVQTSVAAAPAEADKSQSTAGPNPGPAPDSDRNLHPAPDNNKLLSDATHADGDHPGFAQAAFDLRREIDACAATHQATAANQGVTLQIRYPASPLPQVIGNPLRLRQAISALLDNAARSTPHGRVRLEVEAGVQDGLCMLRIAVADRQRAGGNSADAQGSGERSMRTQGLGLSACKHLVEAMGGQMGADSEPGGARIFWISLPLPLAPAQDDHPNNREDKLKTIFVEADPLLRKQLTEQMQQCGLHANGVASAAELVTALGQAVRSDAPYRIAMLDRHMSDVDAETLGAALTSDPVYRDIHLIILGTPSDAGELQRFARAGFCAWLDKPLAPHALREVLMRVQPAAAATPHAPQATPLRRDELPDELAAMQQMFGDDFAALATLFLTDSPKRLASLQTAVMQADAAQLAKLAHTMAGSSASIGAPGLAGLCKELALHCKSGAISLSGIDAQVQTIAAEYARVEARLREMLAAS